MTAVEVQVIYSLW